MSDTCIVCLGDLSSGDGDAAAPVPAHAKSPLSDAAAATAEAINALSTVPDNNPTPTKEDVAGSIVAHLRPCNHYLHNECLTPWVERANSCPICRASFHLVELMKSINGTVLSSYTVDERTQVAELDPSVFLEIAQDEDDEQPCQACGEDDNEDVLMYCDGCGKLWHTYCVDLQEVPSGAWFCDNCQSQRQYDPRAAFSTRGRLSRRRTRGQQRRHRGRRQAQELSWNQVWQSVWAQTNIDLDFPDEDDASSATALRRHRQSADANRVAHSAWERRQQVAAMQGAGNIFRHMEPSVATSPRGVSNTRPSQPSPVSQGPDPEEELAWRAFDQARAATEEPTTRKRKRKSTTASPREPENTPASSTSTGKRRRLSKSSRTASEQNASTAQPSVAYTSMATRARPAPRVASPTPRRPQPESSGPSFLQSLLQEVEHSAAARPFTAHRPSPLPASSPPADQNSPRPSSPAMSPQPSNHSSPRAMSATPPPTLQQQPPAMRPNSPGLSSSIQPIFEYSPLRTTSPEPRSRVPQARKNSVASASSPPPIAQPKPRTRIPAPHLLDHAAGGQTRSNETSPTRATMSLTAKADVQKLVATALKPHYNDQTITKDEYTAINRDISRMLYEKIGDFEALDVAGKAKWEKVAGDEVEKAVGTLKAQPTRP